MKEIENLKDKIKAETKKINMPKYIINLAEIVIESLVNNVPNQFDGDLDKCVIYCAGYISGWISVMSITSGLSSNEYEETQKVMQDITFKFLEERIGKRYESSSF